MIAPRLRNVALLVAGCFFMENLDGTIVTTAAPSLAEALHVPVGAVSLVITAYLVTLAVLIPLSGWLAKRFGTRRIFLLAIAVFTVASLCCGLSQNLPMLVAARVLQGAGGAMMVPVGRVAVFSRAEKSDLIQIVAYITWPALLAPVLAPLAGGLLATYASWRWIFMINIPLGLVAFVAATRLISDDEQAAPPGPFDGVGVVLTAAGFGGLAYTAHLVAAAPTSWPAYVGLAAALIVTGVALRHLARTAHPLLDLRVLRIDTLRFFVTTGSLYRCVVGAIPFTLPLLLQEGFGWTAVQSGSLVLWIFVGNLVIKPATTPMLHRLGFRPTLLLAIGVLVISTVLLGWVRPATPVVLLAALALLSGVARSVGFTVFNTVAVSDVEPVDVPDANAMMATTQQLSAAFGVAVATMAIQVGRLLPWSAFTTAFVVLGFIGLAALIGALRLDPRAGHALRRSLPVTPRPSAR